MAEVETGIKFTANERYKHTIIETLNKSIAADMENDRKAYYKGAKHVLRMTKKYMTDEEQKALEIEFNKLKAKIEVIDKEEIADTIKADKKLNLLYEHFDRWLLHAIDAINHSNITENQTTAELPYNNMETCKEFAKAVKK